MGRTWRSSYATCFGGCGATSWRTYSDRHDLFVTSETVRERLSRLATEGADSAFWSGR
jgi:hypothetical protein